MLIIDVGRQDVFIQTRELTIDFIQILYFQLIGICVQYRVVPAAVGHIPVGIRISGTPIQFIRVTPCMFSRKLSAVGGTALVVILCTLFIIALCIRSLAISIAVFSQLVEDILEFITVISACRHISEVQHGSHTYIVIILVIHSLAQIVGTVMSDVIGTIQIIIHIQICFVGIAIIYDSQHS